MSKPVRYAYELRIGDELISRDGKRLLITGVGTEITRTEDGVWQVAGGIPTEDSEAVWITTDKGTSPATYWGRTELKMKVQRYNPALARKAS